MAGMGKMVASPGKGKSGGPRSNHSMSKPGSGGKSKVVGGIQTPYIQAVGKRMGGGRK